jgi:C_GCAxxG_C_C family probable redox protein
MSENCNQNCNAYSDECSEINSFKDRAVELFKQGYNCSQSVFAAFCEECEMDFETALKISSSFGGGMGRLREVCGAVSGMFMVAGMKYGYINPKDRVSKAEHYKRIQQLAEEFKEKNGSIICRELLGLSTQSESYIPEARTEEYYKKRPCAEIVGDAAEIMYEFMKSNKTEGL